MDRTKYENQNGYHLVWVHLCLQMMLQKAKKHEKRLGVFIKSVKS